MRSTTRSPSDGTHHAHSAVPRAVFYSVAQVAEMLGMSSVTLYRAISAGEFPAIRVRGRVVVPAAAVDAMTEAAVNTQSLVEPRSWVGRFE